MSSGEENKEQRLKFPILTPSKLSLDKSPSGGGFSGLRASKLFFPPVPPSSSAEKKEDASEKDKLCFLPLNKEESKDSGPSDNGQDNGRLIPKKESTTPGFTFGENLEARAENFVDVKESSTPKKEENEEEEEEEKKKEEESSGQKEDSNYFSASIISNSGESLKNGDKKKSLNESAAEYQEMHSVKRKYEEVAVTTGEEDELNVLQIPAKLHSYNKSTGTWTEKGRGLLRLNDMNDSSRLIMRSVGVLKVILNTKIFPGMSLERPNDKAIRLTGVDDEGVVKIFLLSGSTKDVAHLYDLTKKRLDSLSLKSPKRAKSSP